MKGQKTIAVDFDGVIHKYSKGWHDGSIYDEPVEGAGDALGRLQHLGYKVVVFTTRQKQKREIARWIKEKLGLVLEVQTAKPLAMAYIDDRAIRFTNWRDILNYF